MSLFFRYKILMKCARRSTKDFESEFHCTSDTLQAWVFVALQYVVISKKLLICDYDTRKLSTLVRNLGKRK